MVELEQQLSSTHYQYRIISTDHPLKLKLKIMKITTNGDCEKIHHHRRHGGAKKSKHSHKHKHIKSEMVDLSLGLGLFGQQDVKSTATPVAICDKIKNFGVYTEQEEEEEKFYGVSTKLTL